MTTESPATYERPRRPSGPPYWETPVDVWSLGVALLLGIAAMFGVFGSATQTRGQLPTIVAPINPIRADVPGFQVSGGAPPNARVQVVDGDQVIGETTSDANGRWTVTLPALAAGTYPLLVRLPDSPDATASAPLTLIVDENAAASPPGGLPTSQAVAAAPDGSPTITSPAPGATIAPDALSTIEGTAPPGSTVQLFNGDQPVGQVVADAAGKWVMPVPALPPGPAVLTVKVTGPDGVEQTSPPINVTVAAPQSPIPVITSPELNATLDAAAPGAVSGTAAPGANVQILDGSDVLGETTADETGAWTFPLPPLTPGSHTIFARVTEPDGRVYTSDAVSVTVAGAQPTVAAGAPSITVPPGGVTVTTGAASVITGTAAPGAQVEIVANGTTIGTVTANEEGEWSFEVPPLQGGNYTLTVQTDAGVTPAVPVIVPGVSVPVGGLVVDAGAGTISGTAKPNEVIEILIDGQPAGQVAADADGKWSLELPELKPGQYEVSVKTEAGTSEPVEVTIEGDEAVSVAADVPANVVVDTETRTISGTASPGAEVEILANGRVIGTATAGADGAWTFEFPTLGSGNYVIRAQTEAGASPPVNVSITTTRPVVPIIRATAPGRSIELGAAGQISGTASPSATVEILADDRPIGTATADGTGAWVFDLPDLKSGSIEITARTDAGTSAPVEVRAPVPAPVIVLPRTGDTVPAAPPPQIRGTAGPNATVEVFAGETKLGQATADRSGNWRYTPGTPLPAGKVVVTARAADADGRQSAASAQIELVVSDAVLLPTTGGSPE